MEDVLKENAEKPAQVMGKHVGLLPTLKRDQQVALSLTLWCLVIVGLLFAGMFLGAPVVQTEYNLGELYEPPETVMGLIFIMWPLYASVFLAVFMKERVIQVLWVLFAGCLPALLLLVLVSLEYHPEEIEMLFFVLILYELLIMLASVVYLGNFWAGWFKGKSRGPLFKTVSLQLCVLMIVLAVIGMVYSQG